jgi:hypothetical protein
MVIVNAIDTVVDSTKTLAHTYADLGGAEVAIASTPTFFDNGNSSTPTISDVVTDVNKTVQENWFLSSNGKGQWRVEGSISGRQLQDATSDQAYTSDNGQISFTIFEGERVATDGDRFLFGTIKIKPLLLNDTPAAAQLIDNTLYIANRDNQQVDLLDLNTMTFSTPIPLNDGTSNKVIPTDMQRDGTHLVISNRGKGNSIFVIDTATNTIQSFIVGFTNNRLLMRPGTNQFFILPNNIMKVFAFDFNTLSISDPNIVLNNLPISAALLAGDEGILGNALIVKQNNAIDLADLDTRKLLDTRDSGDPESTAGGILFFDSGAFSNPSLADIITQDGITKTESWTLNYQGVVENSPSTTGSSNANVFLDPTATYTSLKMQIGDQLIIYPDNPSLREEIAITEITNDTNLLLASTPTNQGSSLPYEIRIASGYTMKGSLSGFQSNRAIEGKSAQSDSGEITFSISPANVSSPTTRGDYFSFDTDDGITPIGTTGDYGIDIQVFEKKAYLINQNSNNISVISIAAFQEQTVIN